jgi:hypothetical protein
MLIILLSTECNTSYLEFTVLFASRCCCSWLTVAGVEELTHSGSLLWRGANYFGVFCLRGHGFFCVRTWGTVVFFFPVFSSPQATSLSSCLGYTTNENDLEPMIYVILNDWCLGIDTGHWLKLWSSMNIYLSSYAAGKWSTQEYFYILSSISWSFWKIFGGVFGTIEAGTLS